MFGPLESAGTTRRVVFENLEHDFPRTFTFELAAPDNLVIALAGPGRDGQPRTLRFNLRRQP